MKKHGNAGHVVTCTRARVDVPVIDIHTHNVPCGWPDLHAVTGANGPWPWLRVTSEREAMIMLGDSEFRAIDDRCWNAAARLDDMNDDGIDIQVVSPTPVFFSYHRSVAESAKIATIFNDLAAQMCSEAPDRLIPFCQVPLADPEAACRELDRCLANGHRGVEIGNHVGDRDLDDPGVVEFLQHCASVGAPVFVHPWDMATSARTSRWMAQWLVGMPAETHLSVLAMILGGVFDQVSPDLNICFAHGGGSFAMWLGRMDNAWHQRPDVVGVSLLPPSSYLDRFSVDSVVFTEPSLRLLVDTMGVDRVMMGSDFPYPLGERPAGSVVRDASFLSEEDRHAILGGNALRWLAMSTDDSRSSIGDPGVSQEVSQ
jgi:aminocarboxymuconate-semialdehyde decarboxylase